MKPEKLVTPKKPKLRNYEDYIRDMKAYAKRDADDHFNDTDFYPIRELYRYAKNRGINMSGIKPIKKDRRKICNRWMKKTIYEAEISYSEAISSGKYETK